MLSRSILDSCGEMMEKLNVLVHKRNWGGNVLVEQINDEPSFSHLIHRYLRQVSGDSLQARPSIFHILRDK